MLVPVQEREHEEPFASVTDPAERKQLVAELHKLKTDIFMDMVEAGSMPLRPGVARLVGVYHARPSVCFGGLSSLEDASPRAWKGHGHAMLRRALTGDC